MFLLDSSYLYKRNSWISTFICRIRRINKIFIHNDNVTCVLYKYHFSCIIIWQEWYVHGKKIRVTKLTKRITYLFVLMQHSTIHFRDLFTLLISLDYIFKYDIVPTKTQFWYCLILMKLEAVSFSRYIHASI